MRENEKQQVLITGGSSGIGKSLTEAFSGAGYRTTVADINDPGDLPDHYYPVDLTRPDQIEQFCSEVMQTTGAPDVLICNAGRGIHEKLTEGNPDAWEQIFRLNVFSTLRLIRTFVPEMEKRGTGDVVFISSVSSLTAYTYGGIYSATKAAVDKLAETLRLEVQPRVRVTVVRPGVVDTRFFESMISGTHTPEDIGWGALQPQQVADSVLYAVSKSRDMMLNDIVIRPAAQPM